MCGFVPGEDTDQGQEVLEVGEGQKREGDQEWEREELG